ncbi:hypothetical protein [Pantoea agglomerans]|uniref:MrpH family fimbial adhesin n=1 Tax=Enterobacter agglomerans TaxID=549 RepID=UPI003C7D0587
MKRLIYPLVLVGISIFSPGASAIVWSWIDSLATCSSTLAYCYDYNFTIGDFEEKDTTPNPCYRLNGCTLFIGHRHNSAGTSGPRIRSSWGANVYPFLTTSATMGSLAIEFKKVFPLPFSSSTRHSGNSVATEECVGIFYAAGTNYGSYTSDTNNSGFEGHPLLPGSICGTAPAPSGTCDFDQDVLTLDHGTLTRRELDRHEMSENVSISCTTLQTLKLYIFSADHIQLRDDGSLYSELYMNDSLLASNGLTLDVEQQENVTVKSVLRTNGSVEAGEFSGSTVMLITVE